MTNIEHNTDTPKLQKKNTKTNHQKRFINRQFSLSRYNEPWTKLERHLFIEAYNALKNLYTGVSDNYVKDLEKLGVTIRIPLKGLNLESFTAANLKRDLAAVCGRINRKQIAFIDQGSDYDRGHFISIFPEVKYDMQEGYIEFFMFDKVYNKMLPIESYCQLSFNLIGKLESGNAIRLYEIFKSYGFLKKFSITIDDLRKKMGFFDTNKYQNWKYLNSQVLKPAVNAINTLKEYDIEVTYEKKIKSQSIEFEVISIAKHKKTKINILSFQDKISDSLNLLQNKYVDTLLSNCRNAIKRDLHPEIKSWVTQDLKKFQEKRGKSFDFIYACNCISKLIQSSQYSKPFSLNHVESNVKFDDEKYKEIKELYRDGGIFAVKKKFTPEYLKQQRLEWMADELENFDVRKLMSIKPNENMLPNQ